MNVDELQRAHARRRDVTPEDVAAALASSDLNARRLGAIALYYTRMRQSVDALADVCFLHEYRDVGALNLLAQLAQIAENPYPVLVARKNTGLRMIAEGDLHGGVAAVESAVIDANHAAIKGDDRSRKAMALLHDVAIDDAYDAVGARFRSEAAPPPSNTPFRVHIVASALADNAATTRVIVALARHLSARGIDASILLTAHTSSGDSPAFAELAAVGIPVWTAPSGNPLDRALALARRGREDPAHAAVFYAWPMDAVAKLASVVGVAQSHVFVNHTAEQKCGRFEVIAQCTRDFSRSYRPELGRYLSPASVKFDLVEAAQPLDRARLGVRPDQILLGSYGRLSKCVEPIYITATSRILREAPETVLVLPGLPDPLSERDLRAAYAGEGVLDRVRFPGYFSDEYFKLLNRPTCTSTRSRGPADKASWTLWSQACRSSQADRDSIRISTRPAPRRSPWGAPTSVPRFPSHPHAMRRRTPRSHSTTCVAPNCERATVRQIDDNRRGIAWKNRWIFSRRC